MSTDTELDSQRADFKQRCMSDYDFAKRAVAAVLSSDELKEQFLGQLPQSQSSSNAGSSISSAGGKMVFQYYGGPSAVSQLTISVNSSTANNPSSGAAPNQLTLIGYNGQWYGLLAEAAKIVAKFPIGIITTALVQTIFGTKAGILLLPLLLIP